MLEIQNIRRLEGKRVGDWTITDVKACTPKRWLETYHYAIIFNRGGNNASAILIDRELNRLTKQYHIYVCYEDFTYRAYEGSISKKSLEDRDDIISHLIGYASAEWSLRNANGQP